MPYTAEQRRLFHAMAEDPEVARRHGSSQAESRRLAAEADKLAREGHEKESKASGGHGSAKAFLALISRALEPGPKAQP